MGSVALRLIARCLSPTGPAPMVEWSTALLLIARCPHQLGLPRWSSGLRRCYWVLAVSHQLGLPRWSSGLRRCYWLLAVLTDWACPDGRVVYGVATDCSLSSPTGPAPMVEWSTALLLIARCPHQLGLLRWSSGLRRCYWLLAVLTDWVCPDGRVVYGVATDCSLCLTDWACPDGRVVYGVATDCSLSSPTGPAPMVEWSKALLLTARCPHRLGLPRWPSGLRRCYWLLAVLTNWACPDGRVVYGVATDCSLCLTNWACPDGRMVYGVATDCSLSSPTGPAPMVEWSTGLLLIARCPHQLGLPRWSSGLRRCYWLLAVLTNWACSDGRVV